jgi:FixJ family two-component response regulator
MTLVPTELDPSPPLVVVIDDDAGVCSAVSRVLGTGGYRVETFQRPDECLDEVGELDPACILADIRMPELDGIALSSAMRARGVRVPIVFMTGTGDVETVVRAMKQDSADLLAKPFSADALLGAVSRATDLARRSDDGLRSLVNLWALAGRLTPREAEVCALVACGSPNKVVAARIGTTEKTVKVHRGRVMSKLAAPSLAELVRMVDRLIAGEATKVIRLDGVERVRPNSVNIVIDVVKRARGHSAANQDDSPARVP